MITEGLCFKTRWATKQKIQVEVFLSRYLLAMKIPHITVDDLWLSDNPIEYGYSSQPYGEKSKSLFLYVLLSIDTDNQAMKIKMAHDFGQAVMKGLGKYIAEYVWARLYFDGTKWH